MSSNSLNVDQRIVQMEFDNAQFEQGVGTSLKSLDKLKNSLDFAGQKNSIDGLSRSMKEFNASPLVASLSAARSGFSALEVAGITVISNLTSKIMAMGERLVSAVTVDPVKAGWSEYEQKMDSIKTILNSAKDKNGAAVSLDQVKKKIEELNIYADKTIYSFADMTRNIGKFTNAGVDLDTATAAIQGVANAAAAAGADSNAASRAMYNFAQSLSVGYMQRIDWKSIENANMATVEFKDELLKTAVAMGTVAKDANGMYYSLTAGEKKATQATTAAAMFTEKLKDKWLTNDVLIQTLNNYSNTETEIGKKAQEAATKVFTLSKMFDTLKEAMQSGWSATWEKIVGDYDQAGKLFTGINNFLSDIINNSSDKRVKFLDELLNQKKAISKEDWELFKVGKDKKELDSYRKIIKQVARDHGIQIDKIVKKNKTFGESLKEGWFTDDIFNEASVKIREMSTKMVEESSKSTKGNKKATASFKEMTASIGQTTNSLNKLGEATDKSGREMLIDSFKAIFEQVSRVYENIQRAYDAVFPKATASQLYELIRSIRDYTQNFEISINTIYRVRDAFKGFFSIVKLVINIGKTGIRLFLGIIKRLKPVGKMVLDIASGLGRMADSFRKNYEKGGKFKEIVDVTLTSMDKLFQKIKELTQGKSITKDNWLAFTDDLDPKDVELYEKVISRIAREHGVNVDEMIKKNGNFADSLKEDWFTKDIFNEVNYYLDNISAKKRKGPAIYTKEEVKSLKTLRKSLNDTESDWSKLGETAGKTGAEIVLGFAEKAFAPFENIFDVIINNIPKVVSALGTIGKVIGLFLFGRIKTVYKILKIVFTAVYGFFKTNGKVISTTLSNVREVLKKLLKIGTDIIKKVIDKLKNKLPKASDALKIITDSMKEFKDHVGKAFNKVKDFVKHLLNLIDVKDVVGAIAGFFGALAGLTFGGLIFAIDAITKLFTYLSGNKYVTKIFTGLTNAITIIARKLTSGVGKVKEFVGELLKLDGVKMVFDKVKTFFESLGTFVFEAGKSGFETIGNVFQTIGDKLPSMETVLKTINGLLDGTVSKFQTIKDIFAKGIEVITAIFRPEVDTEELDEVEDEAKDQKKSLGKSGNVLKTALGDFKTDIEQGLDNLNSAKILKTGAVLGLVYIIWQIGAAVKNLKKVTKNLSNITSLSAKNPLVKFINGLNGALTAWRRQTDANIVLTIAKAVGILAVAMIALTKLDMNNLTQVTADLFIIMGGLALVFLALSRVFGAHNSVDKDIKKMSDSLTSITKVFGSALKRAATIASFGMVVVALAISIGLVVSALAKLYAAITQDGFDANAFGIAAVSIVTIMGLLIGAIYGLTKMQGTIPEKAALTLLAFGVAVNMIAGTLAKLADIEGDFDQGVLGVIGIMASLTVALIALKKWGATAGTDSLLDISASLLLFAIAVRIVAGAIIKIADAAKDNKSLETALIGLSGVIIVLALAMGLLGHFAGDKAGDMLQISIAMVVFAGAIGLLVKSIEPLSQLKPPQFKQLAIAFLALAGAMLVFGLLGGMLTGLMPVAMFLASIGILAAGVGAGVFLIVNALNLLGPALDSLIDGLISFSKKLVANAPIIAAGITTLIGIVCAAIMAKKALLEDTAYTMFLDGLGGIEKALMAFLPKGKIMMIVGIATLVFALLGALDKVMPGAIDKLLGLLVKGLNSFAAAIVNHSHGLVGAINNIIKAILYVFWEIVSQLMEGIGEFLSKFGLGHVMDKNLKENREWMDKMKGDLLKDFAMDQEIEDAAAKNKEATEKWVDSSKPKLPQSTSTPGNNVNELQSEKNYNRQNQAPVPETVTGQTPEEAYQENHEVGEAGVNGYMDAIMDGTSSLDTSAFSGLFDQLSSMMTSDGAIDTAKISAMDWSSAFGENFDISMVADKSSEQFKMFEAAFGPDMAAKVSKGFSDSVNENTNFDGVEKKAEETQKNIESKQKEASKDSKVEKKQTVTLKTEIKDTGKKQFETSASEGASLYAKTFSKKQTSIKNTVINTLKSAAKGAGSKTVYEEFRSSAIDSGNGILNGLESMMDRLFQKGVRMGRQVNAGYRSGKSQDIESPSKVMYQNALYTVQGLLNGFSDNEKNLFDSGASMGSAVNSGAKRALAQMSSSLADGIDSTPTIRPVLDLSNVEAGARSINGMLGGRTLSVGSINANRLATAMNARQNGSDPLISAIADLGRSLSTQQPSNVYNLNGITYDDGSNIATAIGMLAHAAVVEGRA